jgi:stage III sporulation protein SpoIIIAA
VFGRGTFWDVLERGLGVIVTTSGVSLSNAQTRETAKDKYCCIKQVYNNKQRLDSRSKQHKVLAKEQRFATLYIKK